MHRIVFINRYYHPDVSATSQLLTDLAEDLSRNGAQVKVLTSSNLYHKPNATLPPFEVRHGVTIRRVWSTSLGHHGLFGRVIDYLSFYLSVSARLLLLTRRGDILVAKTDPPLISILVRLVGSARGAKTVNWLQDVFPEVAEQLRMVPRGYGIGNLIRGLRNWSIRYADANVVLGERMKETLLALGVEEQRIHIIPNWADGETITPLEHANNPLRTAWGLEDKFVIAYSGNLGRAHDYQTIINAAEYLRDRTDIVFLWIGGGVKRQALETEVRRRGLENFVFKDYQPREQLQHSLAVADAHFVVLSENLEGLIVPSKFYGIAAAGRPTIFIGDKEGEIARIIESSHCGRTIRTGESEELAKLLIRLADEPAYTKQMGKAARQLFDEKYKLSYATDRWKALCNTVKSLPRREFMPRLIRKQL